jgi:hypothetical protein
MLSFRVLSEKKTKIKINPKQSEITEKKGCPKCEDECGKECKCSCHDKEMSESTYDPMEDPDFDHDEAEATRGQSGKNKSITIKKKTKKSTKKEEVAYVSQEEVSEESNQSIAETETLLTFGQFCEDSRRMSNKQHTARVKQNIKAFGSNFTPPNNWDPDANRGQGEVVTRKQMEKKRRKSLRQEEVEQIDEMPYQVYGSPDGKNEKKIGKPVKSRKYADARAAELADTHKATGGRYRSQKEEVELEEGRAEDAKASLDKVKARQKVLDAHEKKTGKKLDISKTPEHKAHKKEFPGAKRQEKKVKGAKETSAEKHNRQVQTYTDRLKKYGKTTKQKRDDEAMAKHTSRYD